MILPANAVLPASAFYVCSKLKTVGPVDTPEGMADLRGVTLGDQALAYTAVESAIIDDTLPESIFHGCASLKTVGPNGTSEGTADLRGVTLGARALNGTAIESAIIGDTLSEEVFWLCSNLKTVGPVDTPEGTADVRGVTSFGIGALSDTAVETAIIGITLPNSTFYRCDSLKTVGPEDTAEGTADLRGVISLGSYTLYETAVEIAIIGDTLPAGTFYGCVSLKTVGPDGTLEGTADLRNVTSLGGQALYMTAIERAIIGDTLPNYFFMDAPASKQ